MLETLTDSASSSGPFERLGQYRMEQRSMRSEHTIFSDLAALCVSPGYIHAAAFLCYRDNVVGFAKELTPDDLSRHLNPSRLIRTELTTLIGLMMRGPIAFSLPASDVISGYIQRSESLLQELHEALLPSTVRKRDLPRGLSPNPPEPPPFGDALREAIFYGSESAYPSQYRDLAPKKYHADSEWLLRNKSLSLRIGREVCRRIGDLLGTRLLKALKNLRDKPREEWTLLPGFVFSCDELASSADLPADSVRAFIEAFTLPTEEKNAGFTSLNAFNVANAYPFLRKNADEFVLLQYYSISEALYETPFYWMCEDKTYGSTASLHRGEFAEAFASERLSRVFGNECVFRNVELLTSKKKTLGEIDVLVVFGNHAIVVQAKSKRLTLGARKGNDGLLRRDFQHAIQSAVGQSLACAKALRDTPVVLRAKDGRSCSLNGRPQTIYTVTLVADHYPALAVQAHHFLKAESDERIRPPLVTDVFALDVATEMLDSPLAFMNYLRFRARHSDKLLAGHEHILVSYYLKYGAEFADDPDMVWIGDDFSLELDVAMAARRDNIPGLATPPGILTRLDGTPLGRIIADIEADPHGTAVNLGLMLQELREDTVQELNDRIGRILVRAAADGRDHDFSLRSADKSRGLTIHRSQYSGDAAKNLLRAHCEIRKYSDRASSWFGLALRPDGSVGAVVELVGTWKYDPAKAAMLREWSAHQLGRAKRTPRIGRNAPCPCGSGKKYKYCCIDR